jgi:hypothetical protein
MAGGSHERPGGAQVILVRLLIDPGVPSPIRSVARRSRLSKEEEKEKRKNAVKMASIYRHFSWSAHDCCHGRSALFPLFSLSRGGHSAVEMWLAGV